MPDFNSTKMPDLKDEKGEFGLTAGKAVIKSADMTEEMQQEAVNIVTEALDKHSVEKDVASYIKKEFDRRHGATWHVVVGRHFGSYVTHETKHFFYGYFGDLAVLIFKSG